jgi:hypothetical protein
MAGACGLCIVETSAFAEEPSALPEQPLEAPASPTDTAAEPPSAEAAAPSTTLNVDIEAASAYVWRGLNLFGEKQTTQTMALFPSVTAVFGPVSVGYWGAYQLTGDNKTFVVDNGVGAESDFIVAYNGTMAEAFAYSARLTAYVYPFADEAVAGVAAPVYLEPGVALTYASAADLGLYVCYYRGLQDATKDYSFVYFNPTIGKTLPISGSSTLAMSLSAGYKIHTGDYLGSSEENDQFDVAANLGATIPLADAYITPQVHAAYLTKKDTDFGDEFIAWAGTHLGYNMGL